MTEVEQLQSEILRLREQLAATEQMYAHFVPRQLLDFLSVTDIRDMRLGMQTERHMTIMFSDIRDFTTLSESFSPQEIFNFLNAYLSQMEPVLTLNRGVIDKYVGDAIMAFFPECADDAVLGALGMLERLNAYNTGRIRAGYAPTRIGIGINTGIVMLGTVGGTERMDGTVISDAVNVASRLESVTKDYGVSLLISENTLRELAEPERYAIRFIDRLVLKGKQEAQSIYEVYDNDSSSLLAAKRSTQRMFDEALASYHLRDIPRARTRLLQCLEEIPNDKPARLYLDRCDEYLRSGHYEGSGDSDLQPRWYEHYNTGDPEIDGLHRGMLNQMGQVALSIRDGHNDDAGAIMAYLAVTVREHFEEEEALMQTNGYPFTEEHRRQHQRLSRTLDQLSDQISANTTDPVLMAFLIKLHLCDWLINHGTQFDRHLAYYLRTLKKR